LKNLSLRNISYNQTSYFFNLIPVNMKANQASLEQPVDVIVIGSGIGGLSAAALLAKAGKSVLVLEQHDRPGGYAHGFKRKRYHFDSGVHLTSGCGLQGYQGGGIVAKILQAVNVYDQLEFISVNPFAYVDYPHLKTVLPQSIDAFVEQLGQLFPDQAVGLRALLELCLQVAEQVTKADEMMRLEKTASLQTELAVLFRYRRATLAEVWGDFIQDPQLQAIFASHWPYLGLPPSKVSFVYWATMLMGYLVDGAYYCKGGFQKLPDSLVNGLLQHHGQIRYKTSVTQIEVSDNQVQSVLLATGERIQARTVISNADMRTTVLQMIGEAYFPKRYIARMKAMQHSQSIFVVYLATDLDLRAAGVHHESFYYDDIDHDANYTNSMSGDENLSWLSMTVPTLVDASLAPAGEHLMILTRLVCFDGQPCWKSAKALFVEKMLDYAEQKIPGLKQHILFVESGSPTTLQRYTLNHKGAAYGWDVTPEQAGANRVANKSPINGLYFAGHWSTPGGGVYGVSYSGMLAAQQILGIDKQETFWEFFSV
jgi:phytoene desaturase